MTDGSENGQGYTDAAAYPGFRAPELVTLPSGARFLLRKPQILKLMRHGKIPNPLMKIVNETLGIRDAVEYAAAAEAKGMSVAEYRAFRESEDAEREDAPTLPEPESPSPPFAFTDVMVWAAVVQPELEFGPPVDGPRTASGKLSIEALDEADSAFILNWANGEPAEAAQFPAGHVERQGADGDSGTVRSEAERPVGDPA